MGAVRDFVMSGKNILLWTHSGSQGWRSVGGLVMHGGLMEIGIPHKFVYGSSDNEKDVDRIVSYCRAAHMKSFLNMSTMKVLASG